MDNKKHDIIVIGASAGGLETLARLLSQLPANFPATLFIVNHIAPTLNATVLIDAISKKCKLPCKFPYHGEKVLPGYVYLAPPDFHMLVSNEQILVTHGPHENRSRPAIDPLFRSAAVSYGSRVIGIILSGLLDDGTAGLSAVRRCGGLSIIQLPQDASHPDMPMNALSRVGGDYCVSVAEMGELLQQLVNVPVNGAMTPPADLVKEAKISERFHTHIDVVQQLGNRSPYSCPDCGGSLFEMTHDQLGRFRCHAGHSYSAEILFRHQAEKLEETLWVALRMLEERRYMLQQLANREEKQGRTKLSSRHSERSQEIDIHIERLRDILFKELGNETTATEPLMDNDRPEQAPSLDNGLSHNTSQREAT